MEDFRLTRTPMRRAFWIARVGAVLVSLFSLVVVIGHLTGTSAMYRPLPGGPATHPVTAIMTAWLGASLLLVSPIRKVDGAARLLLVFAAGLAAARLGEMLLFADGRAVLGHAFDGINGGGQPTRDQGTTGVNTLVTGILIAAGQLLRCRLPRLALTGAALAPVAPLIATFGYSFGFVHFHGEMSPITVALLLPLSLIGLMSFVRRPMLRPLFSDTVLGRGMRMEFLAGLGLPWAIGAVLAAREGGQVSSTAIHSALMAMFAVTVVVIKTRAHADTEIRRQRTVRALRAAAVTDRLTGLANRYGATMRIEVLEPAQPVGVIIADLDHFKDVNDIWGHAAGDRVLAEVARAFRGGLRSGEILARWGGEEFLVVLPGYDPARTRAMAERLRTRLAGLPGPSGAVGEVSASFGVSERRAGEATLEEAMNRADAALYTAKDAGRDRVVQDGVARCGGGTAAADDPGRLRARGAAA